MTGCCFLFLFGTGVTCHVATLDKEILKKCGPFRFSPPTQNTFFLKALHYTLQPVAFLCSKVSLAAHVIQAHTSKGNSHLLLTVHTQLHRFMLFHKDNRRLSHFSISNHHLLLFVTLLFGLLNLQSGRA